jgi:multidrug efflux pump subunit AcrB
MRHIMEIPGWAYIIVGALIAIVSGVIYKDVPKDGAPNMAMAFFFFVGMIFILIGMAKFFFKKAEFGAPIILEKQESKARQAETIQHTNRVEQHISRLYQQNAQNTPPIHNQHAHQTAQPHHQVSATADQHMHPEHHKISETLRESQHTNSTQPTQHAPPHQQYTIVACNKCGTKNYSHSNYCHNCGNRLR